MTTLRVILDPMIAPDRGGVGRYAEELTRALIETAPSGSPVVGVVSASPETDYAIVAERLPGLAAVQKSVFARRELTAAWQHGFTRLPGEGLIHATSLLAPLYRHDRGSSPDDQIAVTAHDAVAWTHPQLLPARVRNFRRTMTKRAARYADAIVVPTHAVGDALSEHLDLGERVRVIGGAPSSRVRPTEAARRTVEALGLPSRYVALAGADDPRRGADLLIDALPALPDDVGLVLIGAAETESGDDQPSSSRRIVRLAHLDDAELGVVLADAAVYAQPSSVEGFGLTMLEAAALGTPVVHSDDPALSEVMADAGIVVERGDDEGADRRLGEALAAVIGDAALAERMSVAGQDRARTFTWRDSAEKVWQLHADL